MFSTVLFSITFSPTMLQVAPSGLRKIALRIGEQQGRVVSVDINHGVYLLDEACVVLTRRRP